MSIVARTRDLVRAGRSLEASALVEDAVHRGDPAALMMMAGWRLYGANGPRDWVMMHALIDRAIAAGHGPALALKANLVANGTGIAENWDAAVALLAKAARRDQAAAAQYKLVSTLGDPAADLPPAETLSAAPAIALHRRLLPAAVCNWMVAVAGPVIKPSMVVDPVSGRTTANPIRRSGQTHFIGDREDLVIRWINRRLAAVSSTDMAHGEPVNVLRYHPGDEYRPHLDALPGATNQRATTVLVWLKDGFEGGATRFTELDLDVTGKRGDALVFTNVDADGRPDPLTRHAGTPVTKGVKWLCSRWIRAAPFDAWSEN